MALVLLLLSAGCRAGSALILRSRAVGGACGATMGDLYASLPDVVRQRELQAAIELCAKAELTVTGIRQRLEAGAAMERGKLGVSTAGHGEISYVVVGSTGIDGQLFNLSIAPVEELASDLELIRGLPHRPDLGWVLA